MFLTDKSNLIFVLNLVLSFGFQMGMYKRAAIDNYKVLDEVTKAKTLSACCLACMGSKQCEGVKFDQNKCERLSCFNLKEDSENYALIDGNPASNETYFSMVGPMKPSQNNHVHTFKEFGPDYKIKLRVIVKSFQGGRFTNILTITDGCLQNRVQCRQPQLNLETRTKTFKFYSTHDLTYSKIGRTLITPIFSIQLNTVYDMVIQHVNGKLEWIVNSKLIGTFQNSKPRSFVGMKVFLGNPFISPIG